MKQDLTRKEFTDEIKTIWNKRNEDIIEMAAPILARHADGSYRDAMNELQKFMQSGMLNCTVENIVPYLSEEQLVKVTPWLKEKGYGHLLNRMA